MISAGLGAVSISNQSMKMTCSYAANVVTETDLRPDSQMCLVLQIRLETLGPSCFASKAFAANLEGRIPLFQLPKHSCLNLNFLLNRYQRAMLISN